MKIIRLNMNYYLQGFYNHINKTLNKRVNQGGAACTNPRLTVNAFDECFIGKHIKAILKFSRLFF